MPSRRFYWTHRDAVSASNREWRARPEVKSRHARARHLRFVWFRQTLEIWKRAQGCADCGTTDGELVYHHLHPETKRIGLGRMSQHSLESLLDEIAKCVVLCKSCHSKRHWQMGTNNFRSKDVYDGDELVALTVKAFSSRTGIPERTVINHLASGDLRGFKVGRRRGFWRVHADELERFMAARRR